MKFALIGCGRIAASHIKAALANGLEIVALADIALEPIDRLLAEFGLEKEKSIGKYLDYKQMLAEHPELELAAITTGSGLHFSMAMECIEHGVNVLIEKPMTLSLDEADEIIRRSEEKGVKICVCHQNRYNLPVQEMRRALEKGRFGKLSHGSVQIRWHRDQEYYGQASWRGTWAQDGGALMNQCLHGIDLLRWMLGDEVESVYGVLRNRFHPNMEVEDLGMAVVSFKNGTVGTIEGTTNIYPENLEETLCLFGQTGTAKIGGVSANRMDVWQFAGQDPRDKEILGMEEKVDSLYGNGHKELYADMVEAIQQDRPPLVDGYAGRRAVELILAIYKSFKTGSPVQLPLHSFSCKDMQE